MEKNKFHDRLRRLMDEYVNLVYDLTKNFPKEELFSLTSQLRRAALSIILNYIEGYARNSKNTLKHFLEISFGSFKESKYLSYFSHKRGYITEADYKRLNTLEEEIGAMLWGTLTKF